MTNKTIKLDSYPAVLFALFFVLLAATLLFAGCAEKKDSSSVIGEEEISFETISKDFYSEQAASKNYIIKSEDELNSLWNTAFAPTGIEVPEVDFEKYLVIAVFQGQQNTGGYDVEIIKVTEDKDMVFVYINEISPGESDMVAQVITSPYHIIKIEKTEKEIVFKEIDI